MKVSSKRWIRRISVGICTLCLLCPVFVSSAEPLDEMEEQSSELENKLAGINQELQDIGSQIAENEVQMEMMEGEIVRTQEQLAIARKNEEAQYEDMKVRIQYIYENDEESILSMIFSAESLADFVNKVEFVQNISDYDRDMLEELKTLSGMIASEEKRLQEQQKSYAELETELESKREELNAKASATSTDLQSLSAEIQKLKEKAAREAAAKAAAEAAKQAAESGKNNVSSGGSSTSGGNYQIPSGNGVLTPSKGKIWYIDHWETYYSQKVLPGHGLQIPGRHVAADGTIRDADNYICVASSDHPKGTVVQTSLGPGKVYDTGCASGVIDIYTDW